MQEQMVPPGALPEEVKDDVPVLASEGEYIIPANVVRYLGLEKIEALVNKAKEGLAQKAAEGRIGGQKPPSPTSPPQREQAPVAAPQPRPAPRGLPMPPGLAPGMAEGGLVAPSGAGTTGSSPAVPQSNMMPYAAPNGQIIYIPFVNGRPIVAIPRGYTPAPQAQAQPAAPSVTQNASTSRNDGNGRGVFNPTATSQSSYAQGPDEWSVQDFVTLGDQLNSGWQNAVHGAISRVVPFGGLMNTLHRNNLQNTVPAMLDSMIEEGVDREGIPIGPEDLQGLVRTRETMRDQASRETGTQANPFERISNFFGRITGGNGGQTAPVASAGGGETPRATITGGNLTASPDKAAGQPRAPKDWSQGNGFRNGGLVTRRPT